MDPLRPPDPGAGDLPDVPEVTLAALQRWTLFGATWRVVHSSGEHVVIDMCACTGETVEQRSSRDPAVIEYLLRAPRESS